MSDIPTEHLSSNPFNQLKHRCTQMEEMMMKDGATKEQADASIIKILDIMLNGSKSDNLACLELTKYGCQKIDSADFRQDLCVPFEEKDEANALGARWDQQKKVWFAHTKETSMQCAKWIK